MQSATLSEIVDVLGYDAAKRLARHFPGYPVPVPHKAEPGYLIAQVLNEEEVGKMIERYSGQQLRIPVALARYATMQDRNQRVRARHLQLAQSGHNGDSIPLQIAREEDLTYGFVLMILKGWEPEYPVQANHLPAVFSNASTLDQRQGDLLCQD
jgi:hypothetical protein